MVNAQLGDETCGRREEGESDSSPRHRASEPAVAEHGPKDIAPRGKKRTDIVGLGSDSLLVPPVLGCEAFISDTFPLDERTIAAERGLMQARGFGRF